MNLFEISNDFRAIIAELEETGGELTPEIEEKLSITESNLKDKLNDYANYIKTLQSDIEACSLEVKRINFYKKSKENLVDRLKALTCSAVEEFGDRTKTGGAYYDLGTAKLSVRKSKVCELDEELIDELSSEFYFFIRDIKDNNILNTKMDLTEAFIKYINNSDCPYDITKDDIDNLKFSVNVEGSLASALDGSCAAVFDACLDKDFCDINLSANKNECKRSIENNKVLSFASVKDNKSLTIK